MRLPCCCIGSPVMTEWGPQAVGAPQRRPWRVCEAARADVNRCHGSEGLNRRRPVSKLCGLPVWGWLAQGRLPLRPLSLTAGGCPLWVSSDHLPSVLVGFYNSPFLFLWCAILLNYVEKMHAFYYEKKQIVIKRKAKCALFLKDKTGSFQVIKCLLFIRARLSWLRGPPHNSSSPCFN